MTSAEPASLRGWLLVLSRVMFVWEPLEFAVAAAGAFNAIAVRGWPVAGVLAVRLAGAAVSVAAARSLSNRSPSSPAIATAALLLVGGARLFALLTPFFPSNRLPGQTLPYVLLTLVYYGGSVAYLAMSQQARAIRTDR